ncbi:protein translocase subunit SecF [Gordonia sp. X0973]|uniref:protein translocase subunit SecF n=1 Tax=Gordonia sp. X0973 TaxID=2742602 RepID=UPI000F51CF67|nr:protein translocase subunit SecF [Gordonia sp. X0973]QKT07259.1 protein translocase subunit SecF [Gordonia sp. X0973]
MSFSRGGPGSDSVDGLSKRATGDGDDPLLPAGFRINRDRGEAVEAADTLVADADFTADANRSFLSRLYTGTGAFEVVGHRKRWYMVTGVILAICLLSILLRGFTFGIDFQGGTQVSLPATDSSVTVPRVEKVFTEVLGKAPEMTQTAGSGAAKTIQVRVEHLDEAQANKLTDAIVAEFSPALTRSNVSSDDVSSTWGSEITRKMVLALVVFLVIVTIYIAIRFDKEMSIASLASLFFDVIVTAGVYSIVGFEVTPATVIGLLTILGFSIYDTVVVFDKVEENTRSFMRTSRRTYAEQANLAVNQTLMRSINTTVISILPIIALMVIAVWMLGVGTLQDLALIQLVGVVVGTFSSVFLATPMLVSLKERNPDIAAHTRKVLARRAGTETKAVPAAARRGARHALADGEGEAGQARPTGKRRRSR